MPTTSPISATNSIYTPTEANPRVPQKTLDQNDFLKLLVTQFTNQDPMNPLKDTEYIAQMAQFTTLEQSKAMTASVDKLRADQATLQANSMIGRTVELQSNTDGSTKVLGIVSGVEMEKGEPLIVVNDQPYALSDVLSIRPTPLK